MHQSPVQNSVPSGFGMASSAPVFHPQRPQPQPHYTSASQQLSAAQRQAQTDALMAASGLQGSPSIGGNRKRNSISLNTSTNRRCSTALAGSSFSGLPDTPYQTRVGRPVDFDPSKPKKRSQIACGFFANSDCRNGDSCDFAHTLPDGTDAKQLKQNIIGVDGRIGDTRMLEEFRVHREAKDREWRKNNKFRDSAFTSYEPRGRDRYSHPSGDSQEREYRQYSKGSYRKHSKSQQRVPNGADFPALPATPRSESVARPSSVSSEPTSDTEEKMASSIASLTSVDSHKPLGSFASAAARGAQVPQPPASSRKLNAAVTKVDRLPHSPITTAQNLSPDLHGSPLLATVPIAA